MADGANIDAMSLQFSSVNSRPCPSDRFVMCFLGTRRASGQLIVTAPDHTALDTMPLADGLGSTLEETARLSARRRPRSPTKENPPGCRGNRAGLRLSCWAALVPSWDRRHVNSGVVVSVPANAALAWDGPFQSAETSAVVAAPV